MTTISLSTVPKTSGGFTYKFASGSQTSHGGFHLINPLAGLTVNELSHNLQTASNFIQSLAKPD